MTPAGSLRSTPRRVLSVVRRITLLAPLLLAIATLPLPRVAAAAAAAVKPVPPGFVGVVVDEPTWPDPFISLPPQLKVMSRSGVETIRVAFAWNQAQPYSSWSDVPADERSRFVNVNGVPTDFSQSDELVAESAADRLKVLPTLLDAPDWDGQSGKGGAIEIPRRDGPYAAYAAALVKRYGPRGTFWARFRGPKLPITMWQVWNEPNIPAFWPAQPFQARYVGLLKATHQAIKRADPHAEVVLAGLPNYSWKAIARIYSIRGARAAFEIAAVHPYTKYPQGVITILGDVRRVMDQHGDTSKPIIADEISWPSSEGKTIHDTGYDFATTESGQAQNIKQVLPLLAASRTRLNLLGFYYYDWAGLERPNALAFDFAGLFRLEDGKFVAKPAYSAFRDAAFAIEGCGGKSSASGRCPS